MLIEIDLMNGTAVMDRYIAETKTGRGHHGKVYFRSVEEAGAFMARFARWIIDFRRLSDWATPPWLPTWEEVRVTLVR